MALDLAKRSVGTISREPTVLGLGCWAFGVRQWGAQDDGDSREALAAALEAGITHLDTAEGYGSGHSEKLIGEFMPRYRERVFLATKIFPPGNGPAGLRPAVEASLQRLRTDSIDLYYLHWPKSGVDMRPYIHEMEALRDEGKIRGIGVSNFNVEQLNQVRQAGIIDAHQIGYNLFWRFAERSVIPFCESSGISIISYSSIAQGLLTGKFGPDPVFPDGDSRSGNVFFDPVVYPHLYTAVQEMKKVADEAGRPLVELAIRWAAAQSGVASVLVGARNAKQVEQNLKAMQGRISPAILNRLTAISDEACKHVPDAGNIFRYYP